MTDPTSPQAIATRLTPRQQEALLWLPADGSGKILQYAAGPAALLTTGLVEVCRLMDARTQYRLTPLGRRVREEAGALKENDDG